MKVKVIIAAAIACLATPALAVSENITCLFKRGSAYGFAAPEVRILHEDGQIQAMVYDGIIAGTVKKPIPATVSTFKNGSVQYSWSLDRLTTNDKYSFPVNYDLRVNSRTGRGTMMVRVPSYSADFSARGKCTRAPAVKQGS